MGVRLEDRDGDAAVARSLRGCYVQTPYGWGICAADDPGQPHLQVSLDWRLADQRRVPCWVRRADIKRRSFCAAGECVLTTFGTGVLLGFRPEDGMHHVQLWGSLGRGRNSAYLREGALLAVVPAVVGLEVDTPYGSGVCRSLRLADDRADGRPLSVQHVIVDLPWGKAFVRPADVTCAAAITLPLVHRFLGRASDLLKVHSSTLASLREALQGLGLERLQERLTSSAGEAAEVASRLWDEMESMDAKAMVDSVQLKADEYMADPQMKEAFSASISRLNKLVCQAEGFNGLWIGKSDGGARCEIMDAVIKWHWGEESDLEIWSAIEVTTNVGGEIFHGNLLEDGSLYWQEDNDTWVCAERQAQGSSEQAQPAEAADVALVQRSLQDLRRIVAGETDGLEGSVEEALGALSRVASGDGEVQRVLESMQERRDFLLGLRGQLMQSRTGQVLQEGKAKLAAQLSQLQQTAITPQLQRVHQRSRRLVTRITTDRKIRGKAVELFSAAQSRLSDRWSDPNSMARSTLEAWVSSVKERAVGQLGMHRAMLVEGLDGLNLQQLDIRQLVANSWDPVTLEAQLERSLVRAVRLSGMQCTGSELLDRFESSDVMVKIPAVQRTYQGVLSALADLQIEVPLPIRSLLEAQAAGRSHDVKAWQAAITSSLDDDSMVSGASELVKQGERVLTQLQELKGSSTVARVMEHLESEDLEKDLLKRVQDLDPEALLSGAEGALTSAEARQQLVSQLKDTCLDFILRMLPAIHIEKLTGSDNGCDWEISNISFSDFSFRKENVYLSLGTPSLGEELLRLSAWDISAHFRGLKVFVKQKSFPYIQAEGQANALAERMSVSLAFRLQPVASGAPPKLVMSSRSVELDSLELTVSDTGYAVIINALSWVFADMLKGYAGKKIASHLDDHMGSLVGALNSLLETCAPLLVKLGISLPAEGVAGTALELDSAEASVESLSASESASATEDDFPEEILWADPGRSFAVRV